MDSGGWTFHRIHLDRVNLVNCACRYFFVIFQVGVVSPFKTFRVCSAGANPFMNKAPRLDNQTSPSEV
jgi:hypothetical protein